MVKVTKAIPVSADRVWGEIGSFTNLQWTGDDPWEFSADGTERTLKEHGMKERLVTST
eukprot:CAMPEP_0174713172 /NCGR_PEP_ID=MMETSP1094-20130205/13940_1 /TAXON_ID=156173 /ORGANISM="Chrysochromulina brevifilum, Strain UTEX LB 985" /LENGTH=57 /DNA_ID=CAMNT_0015912331 /DNA_START=68 /DNA_END=238 /DNA_ORIENTATION=+